MLRLSTMAPNGPIRTARLALAAESDGEVSRRSGIDLAALSRLENGIQANYTMATIQRYARAIGKRVALRLEDAS